MENKELKQQIKSDILKFRHNTILESALKLFSTLGYTTKRQIAVSSIEDFKGRFLLNNLNEDKALYSHWKDAQFLFELQPNDLNSEETEITGGRIDDKDIETIVKGPGDLQYKARRLVDGANQKGGIVSKEAPIHISNVALVVNGETTKVGFEIKDGKKVRIARKTGEEIK